LLIDIFPAEMRRIVCRRWINDLDCPFSPAPFSGSNVRVLRSVKAVGAAGILLDFAAAVRVMITRSGENCIYMHLEESKRLLAPIVAAHTSCLKAP
jgi:hypothetical protein